MIAQTTLVLKFQSLMLPKTNDPRSNSGAPSQPVFPWETQRLIDAAPQTMNPTVIHEKVAIRMQELEREMLALKTCHNAATFICRLPVEILSNVFLLVQALDKRSSGTRRRYTWIWTSHVCRHWRSTAIDCPTLWTFLDFSRSTEFLERSLERSRNAPLSIYCREGSSGSDPELLARGLAKFERIRSLVMTVYSDSQTWHDGYKNSSLRSLLSTWTSSAPLLRHLDLKSYMDEADMLPSNFLANGAPGLSCLRLHGRFEQFPKLSFPSVTILDISSWQGLSRPQATEFFDALTQMPLLQNLKTSYSLPVVDTPIALKGPRIILSSLKTLEIYDPPEHINHFLQKALCPAVTFADVSFAEDHASPSAAQESLDSILDSLCRSQQGSRVFLRQLRYGEMHVEMGFDTLVHGSRTLGREGLRRLSVFFSDEFTITELIEIIQGSFNFETLTSLESDPGEYYGRPIWDSEVWRFFGRLPNLKTVVLSNMRPQELCPMLQEVIKTPSASTAPFPRLFKLAIISVRFGAALDEQAHVDTALRTLVAILISAVQSRQISACPISSLLFGKATRLKQYHVSLIREQCPGLDFMWDGD
ncbi:hypothetical protein NMY22_g18851 [Coprinellus aureogranulatus]|nr:hypothetical protein NMY22_g18851 [Coprinellus aureogranulatus]